MNATMMEFPLSLHHILDHAARMHSDKEIISQAPDKSLRRHTYADLHTRSHALAKALTDAGLKAGDRVATLMWNHHAHVETYFGSALAGGVYHTLNPRLAPQDLIYIMKHAGDRFLIIDDSMFPLYAALKDHLDLDRVFIVRWSEAPVPDGADDYEAFLQSGMDDSWTPPPVDENQAAGMCYTSGTTGRPKGVVYSHRALVLHSLVSALPSTLALAESDVVVPVVPMFHVNAWGLPFTLTLTGATMVMPGPHLQPDALLDLYVKTQTTVSAGVPTIWMGILKMLNAHPGRWDDRPEHIRMVVGGAAVPEALMRGLDTHNLAVVHAWGMTETSPLGTVATMKGALRNADEATQFQSRLKQGWPAPFVEIRGRGDDGLIPWDGETYGELEVRGPWVASSYYHLPEAADSWTDDGWFRTGDVVTIDKHGYMKITDRTKDLIKSGGEWISSQDLENSLMGHPSVAEAAVIAINDAKWQERPLAVVALKQGQTLDKKALNDYLKGQFATWWLPDGYVQIDEIPRNATGKFLKRQLREDYSDWRAADDDPGAPGSK